MSQQKTKNSLINWDLVTVNPNNKNWNWKDLFFFWGINIQSIIGFSLIASLYVVYSLNSFVVLSDSGTISEESSILNFRALNIRESHERPEAMEEASVILTGLDYKRVLQGIGSVKNQEAGNKRNISLVSDYNIPNVSIKVERIILSYINYVNRVVWQKES